MQLIAATTSLCKKPTQTNLTIAHTFHSVTKNVTGTSFPNEFFIIITLIQVYCFICLMNNEMANPVENRQKLLNKVVLTRLN